MSIPIITLEEHYFSKALSRPEHLQTTLARFPAPISDSLTEIGDKRIAAMDGGKVSLQVISHAPLASSMPAGAVAEANDELYVSINSRPTRFKGFASLPMTDPALAVKELHRCVKELGFVGALLDNHLADGRYYDRKEFWPVFEAAVELDVPIYLHPTFAVESVKQAMCDGDWDPAVSFGLSTSTWTWHSDIGLHICRLFASGLFDVIPKLKLVVGHMGEMFPFMIDRVHNRTPHWAPKVKRDIYDVWQSNFYVTSSGFQSLDPMACLLRNTKHDHIMYSVDYPFVGHAENLDFLMRLKDSGMLTPEEYEGFAYKNAEKLLKVEAGPAVGS